MRMIFVNLPVRDLDASKRFFGALGFTFNEKFSDETATCMIVDENIFVMLLTRPKFEQFINGPIAEPANGTEVLTCLSCDSRAEVDETLQKALANGGKAWKPVMDYGAMYGASFQDPDGHVWELMWMDPVAAEQGADAFEAVA